MLPKSFKFAKFHKGSLSSVFYLKQSLCLSHLNYTYHYGLVALQPCRITGAQLSAIVFGIKRKIKQDAVLFLRVFPHFPVTAKPAEVRMGNGKGSVDY
jgi:large subunit ribosomal protein L16